MWPWKYKKPMRHDFNPVKYADESSLSRLATPDEIRLMLDGCFFPVTLGPLEDVKPRGQHEGEHHRYEKEKIYFGSEARRVLRAPNLVAPDVAHRNRSEAQRHAWIKRKQRPQKKWKMSQEGRDKIAAAQRLRWERYRAAQEEVADFYAGA